MRREQPSIWANSKFRQRAGLLATVVLVGGFAVTRNAHSQQSPGMAPGMASPANIAIANPAAIAKDIKETKDLLAKMASDRDALQAEINGKQKAINDMKQDLQYYKPDSPQYGSKSDELLKASIEYDAFIQETKIDLERKEKNQINHLFNEVEDAIAKVAVKHGYNIVIADQHPEIPDNLDNLDLRTLQDLISRRTILYSDQTRDISGEVETTLDADYANRAAAAAH